MALSLWQQNTSNENKFDTQIANFSEAKWEPSGSFADTRGVSIGGNTAFAEVGGNNIARAVGDCEHGRFIQESSMIQVVLTEPVADSRGQISLGLPCQVSAQAAIW